PDQPGAAMAHAPARPAARRVLRREAARAEAARGELPASGARNRRSPHARREEPAAVAERAVLGRGAGRFPGPAGADAPPAAGDYAAAAGDAREAAAPGR